MEALSLEQVLSVVKRLVNAGPLALLPKKRGDQTVLLALAVRSSTRARLSRRRVNESLQDVARRSSPPDHDGPRLVPPSDGRRRHSFCATPPAPRIASMREARPRRSCESAYDSESRRARNAGARLDAASTCAVCGAVPNETTRHAQERWARVRSFGFSTSRARNSGGDFRAQCESAARRVSDRGAVPRPVGVVVRAADRRRAVRR